MTLENSTKTYLQNAQTSIPTGLFDRILQRLAQEQTMAALRKLKFQLYGSLVFFVGALVSLILSVRHSLLSDTTSLKFLSLAFTDFGTVLRNWQDYSYSVLENLPLGTMALILGTVLGTVILGDYLISRWRNFKDLQHNLI